ncbi:MAG: hypothetical protein U0838_15010 [Chloroflexota bacterium]
MINGKFAAGISVIIVMVVTLILLVTAIGILRLRIIPTTEPHARMVVWLITTVLYASFWLAFALLLSVVMLATATALVGFGVWLAVSSARSDPGGSGLLLPDRRQRHPPQVQMTSITAQRPCSCGSRQPSSTRTSCRPCSIRAPTC